MIFSTRAAGQPFLHKAAGQPFLHKNASRPVPAACELKFLANQTQNWKLRFD
ncbi:MULTISPECIES: hypothetical protein [Eikenella]|uniref:hypothetical protein n=1 Tax=Eikenella TaxID=538 RepID=UPI000AE63225|nr:MULTISPECIES: hypothetical protein [Eikenella]